MRGFARSCSLLVVMIGGLLAAPAVWAQDKKPVTSLDDLPRFTYHIPGSASELLLDKDAIAALAADVRRDVESVLADYDIQDNTTLQRLNSALLSIDMIQYKFNEAQRRIAVLRDLESKPAEKLLIGLVIDAHIRGIREPFSRQSDYKVWVGNYIEQELRKMPWDVIGDAIESRKGRAEILSENLIIGMVQSSVDPIVMETQGNISADVAQNLLNMYFALRFVLPLKTELINAYDAVIQANRVEKADIWAARDVELKPDQNATPVVVGIWDSGVDVSLFPGRVFVNPNEKVDGADDDGDGFVDNVNGIAFDLDWKAVPELLHPLDAMNADPNKVAVDIKGFMDLQAAVDSPEASAVKQKISGLAPDQIKPFIEDLGLYGNYAHGTHVAGIAAAGNPFIRLLPARLTFDYHMIPECPTIERAKEEARGFQKVVDYFKAHQVRVVNMSWGGNRQSIEHDLEANGAGHSADERAALARQIFRIERDALEAAMKSAPEILFITSAGNADNDVEFDEMIPSGFRLPNLLVVGAVDQAGDPTDFTSFGRTVGVYANGFEVESYVPGGKRMKFSGTSMSSPNVTNLAAKILAVYPSLSPERVIKLICENATKTAGDQPLLLIDPKATLAKVQSK